MNAVSYKLAIQEQGRAYYAEIRLAIEPGSSRNWINCERVEPRWQNAVRFGLEYAWKKINLPNRPNRIDVSVYFLKFMEVDTTQAVVAFVSAMALFKACGVLPQTPHR